MKKKFLALVMTLSMVLSLVPMTALATEGDKVDTVAAESQSAGEDANGGSQDSNFNADSGNTPTGGGDITDTSDTNTNTNNKDEGKDSGSENTDGTTPGSPSKPEGGGTTEPTKPETPTEPATPKKAAKIGENEYPTVADAIAAADGSKSIVLLRDVTENIKINKSLTLDLGGFKLSGDGTKTVVSISGKEKDMAVTVKNGTVTGGNNTTNGGGFDIQSGNIEIENCIIEKNTAKSAGGGVNIGGSANVKITGSEIRDNTVTGASGGAIYMASGWAYDGYYNCVCEVVDTKLNGNSAVIGGAVGMGASLFHDGINNAYGGKGVTATFIMDGESIIDGNTAKYGGAVHLTGVGSRFLMKNGTITNNKATSSEGGAIWATNYGGVTIEKGTISNNTSKRNGGAIYIKANIGETNPSAKLAIETGVRDVLNLGEVLITNNSAKQGGGIYIDSYDSAYGVQADLKQASIYNNHASDGADDIYSTGKGTEGCTVQLGETADSWKLDCGDTVDNWYIDSEKMGEGTARWNAHPSKGDLYTQKYTERENLTGVLTLKAAHGPIGKVTYVVKGEIPEQYKDKAPAEESYALPSKYTVAEVFPNVSGVNENGVNGTFSFSGWSLTEGGTQITGEQELRGDVTLYGVWTFTKKSSSGGHRPSNPPVTIPDDVPTGLNGKDHYAYVVGYPDGMVYPQKNITRAEVATIFFRLLTDETREANMTKSNGYNDMKEGAWYTCAVSTLSKMGIIKGYEDGSFKPDASISRAEFAAIAARFDPDGDKTPATFSDVSSHWAKDEISIAANHGWIKGYEDGSFKPDQKITRAETMTLVNRVLKRLPETKDDLHKDMKTWPDNQNESAWFYLAVQEATNSHYQKLKKDGIHETWESMRETRDWAALEK